MEIAAVLVAGAVLYAATAGPSNLVSVKKDDKSLMVQDLPDKEEAASRLSSIQTKIGKLFKRYKDDPATAAEPRVQAMLERYNPENMSENNIQDSTTSYSENKGDRIVICLRHKTEGYPFVDENTVMFVVLHEMAHLMTFSVGHTPEFWANFRRILNDAIGVSIYQNVNYSHDPKPYCGISITDNPL